jgi:hypothetical protein
VCSECIERRDNVVTGLGRVGGVGEDGGESGLQGAKKSSWEGEQWK